MIQFENGILFPDVISLNFTLTMDPYSERPIGSGELVFSVVAAPICQQSVYLTFPTTTTAFVGCGGYVSKSVSSMAPGMRRIFSSLVLRFQILPFSLFWRLCEWIVEMVDLKSHVLAWVSGLVVNSGKRVMWNICGGECQVQRSRFTDCLEESTIIGRQGRSKFTDPSLQIPIWSFSNPNRQVK